MINEFKKRAGHIFEAGKKGAVKIGVKTAETVRYHNNVSKHLDHMEANFDPQNEAHVALFVDQIAEDMSKGRKFSLIANKLVGAHLVLMAGGAASTVTPALWPVMITIGVWRLTDASVKGAQKYYPRVTNGLANYIENEVPLLPNFIADDLRRPIDDRNKHVARQLIKKRFG